MTDGGGLRSNMSSGSGEVRHMSESRHSGLEQHSLSAQSIKPSSSLSRLSLQLTSNRCEQSIPVHPGLHRHSYSSELYSNSLLDDESAPFL